MTPDEMRSKRSAAMDARGRKRRLLAQMRGEQTGLVDVAPIRASIKRLHELGFSLESIATINGAGTAATLRLIEAGASRAAERKFLPIAALPYSAAVPDVLPDTALVPTLGATRRVRALLALGWRHADITELIGRSSGHLAAGLYSSILAGDWRLVDAVYGRLSSATGPSEVTRRRAQKAGYLPPFSWENIDDPTEQPRTRVVRPLKTDIDPVVVQRVLAGDKLPTTRAEKLEITARWEASGRTLKDLEHLMGWKSDRYTVREAS